MNKFTYHVLLTSVLLALSVGANAEAKAAPTRLTTDPAITEKAIAAQMNQVNSENNVNFNNMLLQKNLGDSIAETAAPKSSTLDIDLRGAVTLAIQNNRDITIAELQRREDEADVSAAAAGKNPSLSNTWSASRTKAKGQTGSYGIDNSFGNGLKVTWPIWTGGSVESAINAARYAKNISDLEVYKTEAATKLSAVKAYYNYLEAIKLAEVQHESVSDYQSHLTNVQQQFDAGVVAKLDVLTSNVSLANAKQASIAADNTRDVAEANLNNIMRIPMNTKINALDKEFPEPEFDITMDQAILLAQKYRWELVEADYQVRVANENLRKAKAGYMPTIAVSSGYNWSDSDFPGFANKGWSIGGSVSWPIWDGGATQAAIKKAEAGVKVAQEQLLQSRESVELEVRQDYLNILAAKEQIRATEAFVAEAEEAYKIAAVRYSSGVGTNLDVLDAELQLSTARTNYISALYNYNIGLATLENAMGIPAVIHPEFAAGSENK